MRPLLALAGLAPILLLAGGFLFALSNLVPDMTLAWSPLHSLTHFVSYLLLVLALGESARWSGRARWVAIVALAAAPALLSLVTMRLAPEYAALGFALWTLAPIALALAGARWLAARGETLGGSARVLLGVFAVGLVVQVATNPAFVQQGFEDLHVYNILGISTSTLLLAAMATLRREAHVALRRRGLALGVAGALAAIAATSTLLARGVHPFDGSQRLLVAVHAIGIAALHAGLAYVVLALVRGPLGAKAHDEAAAMDPRAFV